MGRPKKVVEEKTSAVQRYQQKKRKNKKIRVLSLDEVAKIFETHINVSLLLENLKPISRGKHLSLEAQDFLKTLNEDFISSKSKREKTRFKRAKFQQITNFGPIPVDVGTITKKTFDENGIFFCNAADNISKTNSELFIPFTFVMEVGSFGIKYNDMYEKDHYPKQFKISSVDIVETIDSDETIEFWKKRFKAAETMDNGEIIEDETANNLVNITDEEWDVLKKELKEKETKKENVKCSQLGWKFENQSFGFSPAVNGELDGKASNIMKISKWFQDGDLIFNVLMVLYTIKRKEFIVYNENEEDIGVVQMRYNETDVQHCDVQLVAYMDAEDKETILEILEETLEDAKAKRNNFTKENRGFQKKHKELNEKLSGKQETIEEVLENWEEIINETNSNSNMETNDSNNSKFEVAYAFGLEVKKERLKLLDAKIKSIQKAINLVQKNEVTLINKKLGVAPTN